MLFHMIILYPAARVVDGWCMPDMSELLAVTTSSIRFEDTRRFRLFEGRPFCQQN